MERKGAGCEVTKVRIRSTTTGVHGSCAGFLDKVLGLLVILRWSKVMEGTNNLADGEMSCFNDAVGGGSVRSNRDRFNAGL